MQPDLNVTRPISYGGLRLTEIVVGLGEAKVVKAKPQGEDSLVAFGLGSCVAVCLWDAAAGVAGMAHVVLPGKDPTGVPNARFARSAIPALLALMRAAGAAGDPHRVVARLAGGAQVLSMEAVQGWSRVGDANARAVREALTDVGVKIEAVDLGGTVGRSVWFDPRDGGQIRVRAIGRADHYV
jgi:chemotaxis protein CheD